MILNKLIKKFYKIFNLKYCNKKLYSYKKFNYQIKVMSF